MFPKRGAAPVLRKNMAAEGGRLRRLAVWKINLVRALIRITPCVESTHLTSHSQIEPCWSFLLDVV